MKIDTSKACRLNVKTAFHMLIKLPGQRMFLSKPECPHKWHLCGRSGLLNNILCPDYKFVMICFPEGVRLNDWARSSVTSCYARLY